MVATDCLTKRLTTHLSCCVTR
ncbi:hypothetical protein GN244_ATG04228 [Phytophthora infestans]|uniref:Uncharacterized protein n=1 Tax=Phytophthora infestans TaxID=4787 RepID=A0A833WJS1_PHYIN|nr:hypothetical protein GN244_ATG04228 [Phytophthora infestans]